MNLSLSSDSVSGHVTRQSGLKLTGSMFRPSIFSSIFSTVIWRLLHRHWRNYNHTVILEYCGRSASDFKASVDGLGPLAGPMLTGSGRSQGLSWWSPLALGAYVGGLGLSWGICGQCWAARKAYVGSLGRSQGLSWRS